MTRSAANRLSIKRSNRIFGDLDDSDRAVAVVVLKRQLTTTLVVRGLDLARGRYHRGRRMMRFDRLMLSLLAALLVILFYCLVIGTSFD